MKTCSKCKLEQELNGFHKDKSRSDGLHSICKICHSNRVKTKRRTDPEWRKKQKETSRQYKINNPDKYKRSIRNWTLKNKYSITIEEYEDLLEKQNGGCAICERNDSGVSWSKNLHVDHCHTSGKIRGLLCQPCNVSLGQMSEDIDLLYRAIEYLRRA